MQHYLIRNFSNIVVLFVYIFNGLLTLLLLFTFARVGSYAIKLPVIFASSDDCVSIVTTFSLPIFNCVLDRVLGFGRSCFSNEGIAPKYCLIGY